MLCACVRVRACVCAYVRARACERVNCKRFLIARAKKLYLSALRYARGWAGGSCKQNPDLQPTPATRVCVYVYVCAQACACCRVTSRIREILSGMLTTPFLHSSQDGVGSFSANFLELNSAKYHGWTFSGYFRISGFPDFCSEVFSSRTNVYSSCFFSG